jgi:hypothetical protein
MLSTYSNTFAAFGHVGPGTSIGVDLTLVLTCN